MIIAGEASGDLHGAHLVRAMRARSNGLFFCGIGGRALREAGVRIVQDAAALSVVGITEVLGKLPHLVRGVTAAKRLLKHLRPELLILIDFPDFNLHVAATAKKLGIPTLYYISPQVWAWRAGRVKKIGRRVDHVAVILPFEEQFYRRHGIPVTFVGHPFARQPASAGERSPFPAGRSPARHRAFARPSRDREITRHLPLMLEAAALLRRRHAPVRFVVSLAPSVGRELVDGILARHAGGGEFELVSEPVERVLAQCELVIAVSGTVTLEAAIYGTPAVIVYKVSPISYWLGRALIRVKHIGLVNLIAGRQVMPELIQDQATPEHIADTVLGMLATPAGLSGLREEMRGIRLQLGGSGASQRVADIALGMLGRGAVMTAARPRPPIALRWRLTGILGKALVDLLFRTTRIETVGEEPVRELLNSRRFIAAFWHSRYSFGQLSLSGLERGHPGESVRGRGNHRPGAAAAGARNCSGFEHPGRRPGPGGDDPVHQGDHAAGGNHPGRSPGAALQGPTGSDRPGPQNRLPDCPHDLQRGGNEGLRELGPLHSAVSVHDLPVRLRRAATCAGRREPGSGAVPGRPPRGGTVSHYRRSGRLFRPPPVIGSCQNLPYPDWQPDTATSCR